MNPNTAKRNKWKLPVFETEKSEIVRVIMIKFLNDIRNVEKPISNNRKIINTIAVLFLGIALGTFSKFLDFRQAELPSVLMAIDGALDVHKDVYKRQIIYRCWNILWQRIIWMMQQNIWSI